ncbi:MAG TPA: cytochrome c biogenesis protein CcdA [Coriobacteriia bacterium]|nr:cytochrome c biogenesis protein CcdA [Coriobacteriia bacterium]
MADGTIGYASAFLGGLLSFLAPCVLPLVPGYLSFMSGLSRSELAEGDTRNAWRILIPASLFVLGFTAVFVLIGAAAGFASETLSPILARYDHILTVAAGVLVMLVGVFLLGVIKIPWLYGEARFDLGRTRRFGRGAALVMGLAFGFGWTPCVGPILAVILGMAAQTGDVARAASMLAVYSLGLALPFLITAAFFGRLTSALTWFKRHSLAISRAAGGLLIVMGLLMATGQLGRLSFALIKAFPFLAEFG